MFNILKNIKNIGTRTSDLRARVRNADKAQKRQLKYLVIFGASLFILILFAQVVGYIRQSNSGTQESYSQVITQQTTPIVLDKYNMEVPELDVEKARADGIGFNLLDPVGSIVNPIVEAIANLVQQIMDLFDNFVGSTPNIAMNDGEVYGAASKVPISIDKFYTLSTNLAWLLLPLIITVNGAVIVTEGSFKAQQLLVQLAKKVLIFIIAMVATRYLFIQLIDLVNAINRLVLYELISDGNSGLLSTSLLQALGVQNNGDTLTLGDASGFNVFAQAIVWAGLFFFLCMLLFQFIVRFFHLMLHMILFPIAYTIGLLPGGGSFLKSYIEEILRTLFVQPIFLIGVAITIEIIQGGNGTVAKLILGIGSLTFLNTIPSIIARFSGILWGVAGAVGAGIVGAATLGQARFAKKNLVTGATGEKSGSIRAWAFKGIGSGIGNKLGGGNDLNVVGGVPNVGKATTSGSFFKKTLESGGGSKTAFSKIGMSPLSKESLKPESQSKSLYSNSPDMGAISKVSLKDSSRLSSAFMQSNFDSFFGSPMTESPAQINQLANLNNFKSSNPQTEQLMSNAISHKQLKVNMGKTFDTNNAEHMGHLSTWYAKNESLTTGKPIEAYQKFVNNPTNKSEIIKKAYSEGYFGTQGIRTIKITDQDPNGNSMNKYYQVKQNRNARNSSTKAK